MNKAFRPLLLPLLLGLLGHSSLAQQSHYEISFPDAAHHEAEVSFTLEGVDLNETILLRMSRTSPGRYALHEFAKNVYNVSAVDGHGTRLNISRPNPHQWNVSGHDGTVRVTYTLFGDRTDGTYVGIDRTHAHLNMPATFMWAKGFEDAPVRVTFSRPRPDWEIATQLYPTEDPSVFTAPNLAYFLDSPTELSAHTTRTWQVNSNGHAYTIRLAVHHTGTNEEVDRFAVMARRVVAEQIAVFGEAPSYETRTYTFIADYLPQVDPDGMEHRNSSILTSRLALVGGGVERNLRTLSHEFFHAWNVERIRPQSLEPFDLEEANMSGDLWFAEGFTSYYASLLTRRAGIIGDDAYASTLSNTIDTVLNAPGRQFFSPVEMSMRAPFVDAAVSIDRQNSNNTFVSYYTWGAAIALGLDLTVRSQYGVTLDDYMRALWSLHGRTEAPYVLGDLRRILRETTGDSEFATAFFQRYVEGREVMDFESLLAKAGFLLRRANPGDVWIGTEVFDQRGAAVVGRSPLVGSPAYDAGLDTGALLLEVDGRALAGASDFRDMIRDRRPGDQLAITYEYRGERIEATLMLAEDPTLEVIRYEAAGLPVTRDVSDFRQSWLESQQ